MKNITTSSTKKETALQRLDTNQFRLFTQAELQTHYTNLRTAIQIGMNRNGEATTADGGLPAYPTTITPITHEDTALIPTGTQAIACACGGTNWMFSIAKKNEDGSITLSEPVVKPIPEKERIHTFESFTNLFATEIMNVVNEYGLNNETALPIAISFGFPHSTLRLPNGDMDARIVSNQLPKFWEITDYNDSLTLEQQPSLAGLLRTHLDQKGLKSIGPIVFVNDTVAVALDVEDNGRNAQTIPAGFVFGTGVNAAMYNGNEKGIVNLESGHSSILPKDPVLLEMERRGFVPIKESDMEFWVGGGFLPHRMAGAISLLDDIFLDSPQLIASITQNSNQAIVSDIAEGTSARQLELHVGPNENEIVQEIARRALMMSGQLIGVMLAAVSAETGAPLEKAFVPYEGSLLQKGFKVKETALSTVQMLLPGSHIEPYKANGILGVAKLAMCKAIVRGFV